MRTVPLAATLLSAFVLAGCSSHLAQRTGPRFETAFPDPTVLVNTTEPLEVREQLANVQLPATTAHHDRLLELLRSQPRISAAHLLLLVEAVALPTDRVTMISTGKRSRVYTPRGHGEFAKVADQLIAEATFKLVDVDRASCGELIARTHSDATLARLADQLLRDLDDGSVTALQEILGGMAGSPATEPFLVGYLAPQGRLDGERGWAAVGMLSFDDDRTALVRALATRQQPIAATKLPGLVASMSFDEGRTAVVQALAEEAAPVSPAIARDVVAKFSFDEGRQAACATLARQGRLELRMDELVAMTRLFSFDEGRLACARKLAPRLTDDDAGEAARELLRTFSFDEGRLGALEAILPKLQSASGPQRKNLLGTFSFASSRETAAGLLMR